MIRISSLVHLNLSGLLTEMHWRNCVCIQYRLWMKKSASNMAKFVLTSADLLVTCSTVGLLQRPRPSGVRQVRRQPATTPPSQYLLTRTSVEVPGWSWVERGVPGPWLLYRGSVSAFASSWWTHKTTHLRVANPTTWVVGRTPVQRPWSSGTRSLLPPFVCRSAGVASVIARSTTPSGIDLPSTWNCLKSDLEKLENR